MTMRCRLERTPIRNCDAILGMSFAADVTMDRSWWKRLFSLPWHPTVKTEKRTGRAMCSYWMADPPNGDEQTWSLGFEFHAD